MKREEEGERWDGKREEIKEGQRGLEREGKRKREGEKGG